MSTKLEEGPGPLDAAKLALSAALLIGGIVGYYWYEDASILLRALGVIAALALGLLVAASSFQGQTLWKFVQGSRIELRKVIWPTKQETLQTTLTVFVFVLIMGIFFWGLDKLLLWATGILTGRGG
jgi:preprotein translocase subunit SecE